MRKFIGLITRKSKIPNYNYNKLLFSMENIISEKSSETDFDQKPSKKALEREVKRYKKKIGQA